MSRLRLAETTPNQEVQSGRNLPAPVMPTLPLGIQGQLSATITQPTHHLPLPFPVMSTPTGWLQQSIAGARSNLVPLPYETARPGGGSLWSNGASPRAGEQRLWSSTGHHSEQPSVSDCRTRHSVSVSDSTELNLARSAHVPSLGPRHPTMSVACPCGLSPDGQAAYGHNPAEGPMSLRALSVNSVPSPSLERYASAGGAMGWGSPSFSGRAYSLPTLSESIRPCDQMAQPSGARPGPGQGQGPDPGQVQHQPFSSFRPWEDRKTERRRRVSESLHRHRQRKTSTTSRVRNPKVQKAIEQSAEAQGAALAFSQPAVQPEVEHTRPESPTETAVQHAKSERQILKAAPQVPQVPFFIFGQPDKARPSVQYPTVQTAVQRTSQSQSLQTSLDTESSASGFTFRLPVVNSSAVQHTTPENPVPHTTGEQSSSSPGAGCVWVDSGRTSPVVFRGPTTDTNWL